MSGSDLPPLESTTLFEAQKIDADALPVPEDSEARIGETGDYAAFKSFTACGTPNTSVMGSVDSKSIHTLLSPTPSFVRTLHHSSDSSDSELAFNLNDTIDHNSSRHHFLNTFGWFSL